jgi:DNA modification methylase
MIVTGDCMEVLRDIPDGAARLCITSPPYWGLRDYGVEGQIGLEPTPDEYVARLVEVFREVRRVLTDDGTLWLNLGDSYAASSKGSGGVGKGTLSSGGQETNKGSFYKAKFDLSLMGLKPKDLVGIPWMVAFALRADGWYLRQDVIWHKPNPMPESVRDRFTKSHEHLFLLSKSQRYYWDAEAAKEPAVGKSMHDLTGPGYSAPGQPKNRGNRKALRTDVESRHRSRVEGGQSMKTDVDGLRNRRDVWTISTKPFKGAHFATFPPDIVEPCILIGSEQSDVVLDPFAGAGTVGMVAKKHGREFLGIELNPEYVVMAEERCK